MGGQQSTPVPSIPAVPATPTLPPLPVESVPTSAPSQSSAPTCPVSGQKATEDSKCPVKNVPSMFSFTSSSPAPAASSGGCPVKQTSEPAKKADESSGCPVKSQVPTTTPAPVSECPVSSDVYKNPNVYNVTDFNLIFNDLVLSFFSFRSTIKKSTLLIKCLLLLINYQHLANLSLFLLSVNPLPFQRVELNLLGYILLLKW